MGKIEINKKRRNNFIVAGAIVSVCLLVLTVLMSPVGSAAGGASYAINKNSAGKTIVKNTAGSTVFSSSDAANAIQYAIYRATNGGVVTLKAGTYTLTKELMMKSGVTLQGSGIGTVFVNNGIRVSDVSSISLKSFAMKGTSDIYIGAYGTDVSNILVQDVSASNVGGVSAAYVLDAQRHTISSVKFIRVTATECDAYGFMFIGSGKGTCLIKDVTIDSCKALKCGINARTNDWVVGFALAVNVDVTNMYVKNSEASSNWEDGFYLRTDVAKTNVVFENCIANNNGQKPAYKEGFGYYVDSKVVLKNCIGVGNKGGLTNLATPPVPPPTPTVGSSAIALSTASSSVQVGQSMQASGQLTGTSATSTSAIGNAAVTTTVTRPDGSRVTAQVTTGTDGRFTIAHTPSTAGTYTYAASYAGNTAYTGSSKTVTWTATAAPTPPTPPPTPVNADLMVYPGNVVKNANGATVHTGSDAIQWAVNNGNTVLVTAGTYQVSGSIYMRSGTTLMGEGSTKTTLNFARGGIFMDGVSNTAVKGFHITGAGTCQSWANGVTVRNHLWEDIHLDHVTRGVINNAIGTWVQSNGVIDGLTFRKVFVDTPATWGFLINGNNFDGWVKNTLFDTCTAIRCGNSLGVTDPNNADAWIPGFDLAERCNIDGMRLVNCRADNNWESGFHLEIAPDVRNVVFENCTANNNGQKPGSLYGAGFFCGDQAGFNACKFISCTGVGNTRGGVNYDIPNVRVVSIALPYSN